MKKLVILVVALFALVACPETPVYHNLYVIKNKTDVIKNKPKKSHSRKRSRSNESRKKSHKKSHHRFSKTIKVNYSKNNSTSSKHHHHYHN